jgi:hypothetical protein
MGSFEVDAIELAADGWRPISQQFVPEDRTGQWILAFLFVPALFGIYFVWRLFQDAGFGDLLVTYHRA